LNLQIVLFDDNTGPDEIEQPVLGNQLAGVLDQRQQEIECPGPECHGAAFHQQPALVRLQFERTETIGGGHGKKLAAALQAAIAANLLQRRGFQNDFQNV
jgi:hypothetical protein